MWIKRVAIYILLVSIYGFSWFIAILARILPHRRWKPTGRIIVTGTFFNPNWYLSHINPLARSGVKEVILVVDEPYLPMDNVRFVCWPRWMSKLLSRQLARAIWLLAAGIRYKPDFYMGYSLGPGACTALIAGKLMGRPTCYQMTGGPVEIIGGGFDTVEGFGAPLGQPSRFIEKLAIKVVKQFSLVVVRGTKAKEFLIEKKINKSVAIITGSVNSSEKIESNNRDIDLVFVGRISTIKQVPQFIEIIANISKTIPDVKAAVIGEGHLLNEMKEYTIKLGVGNNIEFLGKIGNIEEILLKSKIFILTSKSEGLSIALAEAMVAGVVPVVSDIGELSDLVIDGTNGYLIEPNNVNKHSEKVLSLLQNDTLWKSFSRKAIEDAKKLCDIEVVTEKWNKEIKKVVSNSSGYIKEDLQN